MENIFNKRYSLARIKKVSFGTPLRLYWQIETQTKNRETRKFKRNRAKVGRMK